MSTLLWCFSSLEKGVFKKVSTMSSARFSPIMPPPMASTLASLCSRVILADNVSEHSAHRTPGTLLAAMLMPMPVVQIMQAGIGTKSQQALQLQREERKTERRQAGREQKEAEKQRMFELKQQKRKEKRRGR